MKKFLLLTCLLFTSCSSQEYIKQTVTYDASFSSDLVKLFEFNDQEDIYQEDFPFYVETYIKSSTEYEGYYLITLDIAYKDIRLDQVKIINLPFSLTQKDSPNAISHVGYDNNNYALDSYVDVSTLTFKGYRITYLTKDDQDGMKVYITYKVTEVEENLFYIPSSSFKLENIE